MNNHPLCLKWKDASHNSIKRAAGQLKKVRQLGLRLFIESGFKRGESENRVGLGA
jgi:hypothetical protein